MKTRLLAWLIIAGGMLICRGSYFEDVVYNIDEAEYAVAADALDHGWLPGVDLLGSTKPPGIACLFSLLFHILGRSMAVIHVAHLLIMIALGILTVELATVLWGALAAVPTAVLFWMVSNSFSLPHEIVALNVESPAMVCVLLALWLVWRRPSSRWAILLAGVAFGMASLFRQSTMVFAGVAPVVLVLWRAWTLRRGAALLVGFVVPWLPILMVYGARGGLVWAWDSWVRYPLTYSSDTGLGGFIEAFYSNGVEFAVQAAVPLLMAIGGGIQLWRERSTREARFLLMLLIASLIALSAGARFFGHYWIQVFPALALLGVPAWRNLASRPRGYRWILRGALIVGSGVAALHFPMWRLWDSYAPPWGKSFFQLTHAQLEIQTAKFAAANTRPDETIAVWGYCPQIYYHADRRPGVRDYLCHYTTGYSPGTFDPLAERAFRAYGHPQAQAMFVTDLERRQPKYVFDLVPVRGYAFPFTQYSLRSYPQLAAYLRQNYLPEGQIGDVRVYRRRTVEDTWWPEENDTQ